MATSLPRSEADNRPLAGVKVVEFCQIASGPFCGMLLADFGAEVVKIEPPEGDAMRTWPPLSDGYSENFASLNRGKRSIALDLKNAAELEVARRLALQADVVVENSRPGAMQRLGLGWDWFEPRKPSLVYASISAYGQDGPRGGEGGFDLTIQAAAGVMSVTGEPGGAPVKAGVPLADFAAGLYAAYSIAALLARVRAVLRRNQAPGTDDNPDRRTLLDGRLVIDAARHAITVDGSPADFTVTEFALLEFLAQKPGFVRTRDQIIAAVHGRSTVLSPRTVDVHVTAVRRKLGPLGDAIETVRGVGYRFSEEAPTSAAPPAA